MKLILLLGQSKKREHWYGSGCVAPLSEDLIRRAFDAIHQQWKNEILATFTMEKWDIRIVLHRKIRIADTNIRTLGAPCATILAGTLRNVDCHIFYCANCFPLIFCESEYGTNRRLHLQTLLHYFL